MWRAASLRVKKFGQDIELLADGRKVFKENITRDVGGLNLIPPELQRTAVPTDKWNRKSHRYEFKLTMVEQLDMKCRKEDIIMEKNIENFIGRLDRCFSFIRAV